MPKKLLKIFFATLSLLIISNKFAPTVQGLENASYSAQLWRCLTAEQVGGHTTRPPPDVDVTLTGAGFPAQQDIYIVLCAPSVTKKGEPPSNYKCTTGNSSYDQTLFGSDLTATIAPLSFDVPKGSIPPQTVQAVGDKIITTAHLTNAQGHINYAFFGVSVSEPQLQPGQASTIQYGTFQFQQDPTGCTSIRWDPYGRVFDSQSLEPIADISVNLLDKNKQLVILSGLRNPDTTEVDGVFNFFVDIPGGQPETFYLRPDIPAALGHSFTATPNLHPNYIKAYYDIYKPDDPIIEAPGFPEHRDIPLDPGSNIPYNSTPKDMSYASVRLGRWIRYEGIVSHPLSVVTLVGNQSQKNYAQTVADKLGGWTILMPIENVPQAEKLKTEIRKVNIRNLTKKSRSPLNKLSQLLRKVLSSLDIFVSAQPIESTGGGAEFEPILTYVEGYALDKVGNTIPNATVNVRLEMSDGLYYQTTADENGFFSINPENLPIFPYYLEFLSAGSVSSPKTTTTEFAKSNEDHLTINNVNLMSAVRNGQSLIPTAVPDSQTAENTPPSTRSTNLRDNFNLILTVIIIVLLLGITGGVITYIKKKRAQTDDLIL